MLFNRGYHTSLPQKLLALSVLSFTIISAGFLMFSGSSVIDGDLMRRIVLLSCSVVYLVRIGVAFLVFLKRRLTWQETITVTVLMTPIIFLFLYIGGNQAQSLGIPDIFGLALFIGGSFINTYSEYKRYRWKQKPENKRRLYTEGLFRHSIHINYFGDIVLFTGFAILTHSIFMILIPLLMTLNFVFIYIPSMDDYLASKYGKAFREYARNTRKLIPMVY